jgi:GNAT superfamily N-acetyltransferase
MSIAAAVRRQVTGLLTALARICSVELTDCGAPYISQGLARQLLDHILDYAKREGFKQITLATGELIIACLCVFRLQSLF